MVNEDNELNPTELFDLGDGKQTTLGDILGMTIDTIEEVRGRPMLPTGPYVFNVDAESIPRFFKTEYTDEESGQKVVAFKIRTSAKVVGIYTEDQRDWLGFQHTEFSYPCYSRKDLLQALGTVKALGVDAGCIKKGEAITADEMFKRFAGATFSAVVNTNPSRKNPSFINSKIDPRSVHQSVIEEPPMDAAAAAGVKPAVATPTTAA